MTPKVRIELRMLGPLEVWVDGHMVELGGGRQRALLALLALQPNEVVSSDRLVDELWAGSPPATAHKALQNLVVQLRDKLDPTRDGVLVTQTPGYALRLESDAIDVRRFERLVNEGRRLIEDDPAAAGKVLGDALGMWRGEPLAEFAYDSFAQHEIARLHELRLAAIEDRIDADLTLGRSGDLVPELEALVATNPLRERLRGELMLALYRSGRQADALGAFQQGRRALQDELGLEPGPGLRELQQAILNQDPALGRPAGPRAPNHTRRRRVGGALFAVGAVVAVLSVVVLARDGEGPPAVVADSLVKIDAATNRIVEVIPVGREPGQVRVAGPYVFASSEGDGTLTRVDARTGDVTVSGTYGADGGLAAAGDRFLWVASKRRAEVTKIDTKNLLPIERVALTPDLALVFVAVGGGSLWVSQYPSPAVARFRLRTLELERRYSFGFIETPVEITYGYGAAWVGLGHAKAVLRIDATDGSRQEIPTGSLPSDPALGLGSLWIPVFGEGTVWRVDALSLQPGAIVHVGSAPFGVAVGAGAVWVADNCDGTVSRIDPETNELTGTIDVGLAPRWLAFGHGHLWVGVGGVPYDVPASPCN